MHTSVRLESPVEFLNITPYNPLISRCEIKVCYVGDQANRNKSIITKAVATEMANSLPGSPIVGYWDEETNDFVSHSKNLEVKDGQLVLRDMTKPIGFVDLNAKVWFAKYLDDGQNEHEYLMTEGWLWTGRFPEVKRIIDKGNNQSMELDEKNLNAFWSKDNNGKPEFFIINEAIIKGLCVLGENNEPCFEGAQITAPTIQFSFDEGFKEQLFSMMNELTKILNKEEQRVFTQYSVTIGDALWTALYEYTENLDGVYDIVGVYEDGEQKFAVLKAEDKYSRVDFSINEDNTYTFGAELVAFDSYEPDAEPQFATEAIAEYVAQKKGKKDEKETEENKDTTEEDTPKDENQDPAAESDDDKDKKKGKKEYSLEEIPEYVELRDAFNTLKTQYDALEVNYNNAKTSIADLTQFKNTVLKKEKQEMINSFYMLSDEDKKDVIDHIDEYSKDEIEAKLSIICVRNKVSFDKEEQPITPMTYSFDDIDNKENTVPAWVKSVMATKNSMTN